MFQESKEIELKKEYTRSYLKTVSAFANERDGKVIFGIDDNGEVVGIDDDVDLRQRIENAINDNILPKPNFDLKTELIVNKKIVVLSVYRGFAIPYLFRGKAYMRSDTSTVIADQFRMRKWFQEISNVDFDEVLVDDTELSFDYLAKAFHERLNLAEFTTGTLITLGLKVGEKYTNAGRLFADENS